MSNIRDYMLCQAILDSLTLRSNGRIYFMYELYGIHYVGYSERAGNSITVVDHAMSYTELCEILLDILEEEIANA